jgi:hypothetical protein
MQVVCPLCDSAQVVHVRHDSDWGGPNQQTLLNVDACYSESILRNSEEFADIRVFYCYCCCSYLGWVRDDKGNIWQDINELLSAMRGRA